MLIQGCNGLQEAQRVENVLSGLITLAQSETVTIPKQDQPAYDNYVALATTLDSQLKGCIVQVSGVASTNKKFLACFNSFAVGLTDPKELALLRVLSPKTQSRIQLYVNALIIGANVAFNYFGGSSATPPTITTTQPTNAELRDLAKRVGVEWGK